MSQTYTVPVVAYFNVEVQANDPEDAISRAESKASRVIPMRFGTDVVAGGPPQCVEHDKFLDQYDEEAED